MREMYAGYVARLGVSHERTLQTGHSLALLSVSLGHWDEATTFLRDQLLPAARQSLGADHNITLKLNSVLVMTLKDNPERTRDDLRLVQLNQGSVHDRFDLNTGDDLLEAETIIQDVVQRRRRVYGPAHPDTLNAEAYLSSVHARLANA